MLGDYITFISEFNILGLGIGYLVGVNLKDTVAVYIDDILMPFVNPILQKYSTKKGGFVLSIPGTSIKLNLEKVISSTIKFICLSLIIFALLKFGVKLKKPTRWVSIKNFKDMNKVLKK